MLECPKVPRLWSMIFSKQRDVEMETERGKNRDVGGGVKKETEVLRERERRLLGRMKGHKKDGE